MTKRIEKNRDVITIGLSTPTHLKTFLVASEVSYLSISKSPLLKYSPAKKNAKAQT